MSDCVELYCELVLIGAMPWSKFWRASNGASASQLTLSLRWVRKAKRPQSAMV